ncbi:MAG: Fic family protein [Lachnospiraceae bacterium]
MQSEEFVLLLKQQLLKEFQLQDRKGVYAFTQKNMAYNSNKIEGSTLTSEQTASLFDTGTIYSTQELTYRAKDIEEMNGHFKMFNEVLKTIDKPLSPEMIKSFHFSLKTGVFEDYANGYPVGEFKNRANHVSDLVTELPQNIPERINTLISDFYNSNQELVDIVRFHADYELIHPFQDGNGRTGRAIILKQCLENKIIPVIITNDDKMRYYHALHTAQVGGSYDKLLSFFKDEQEKYYHAVNRFI